MKKHLRIISIIISLVLICSTFITAFAQSDLSTGEIKNVIIMVGDGMGENHLEMAKQIFGIQSLFMENMTYRGQSMTRSFSNKVTDSAAGGTALACGTRVINSCIAVFPYDLCGGFVVPTSITEAALANGMKTGVITTDKTSGATPASFSAHAASRTSAARISACQAKSGFDLIWGATEGAVNSKFVADNGFKLITTADEMEGLTANTRSFGQFDGDLWRFGLHTNAISSSVPSLSQMTGKAIELLDNDNGFVLMVEGAHIDKHSHSNEGEKMAEALLEFDNAIKKALTFAAIDGHTLVIVTADHETGGIILKDGKYEYTQTSHSAANVPLFAFGSDKFIKNGEIIKNKDVPTRAAELLGISDSFLKVSPGFIPRFFMDIFSKIFK